MCVYFSLSLYIYIYTHMLRMLVNYSDDDVRRYAWRNRVSPTFNVYN